jgi:RNA polymerase sigma-70 factor (ECF subfamily)
MLRSRKMRREASLVIRFPDLMLSPAEGVSPEQEAVLSASVGLALLLSAPL